MTEASWLADPTGRHELRYWDGSTWTDHVSDQGVTGLDPVGAPPVAPGAPPAPQPTAPMATEPMPTVGPPPTAGPPPYTPTAGVDGPSFTVPPAELAAAGAAGKGSGSPVGLIVGVAALAALLAVGAWFLFVRDDGDESADDVVVQQSSTTTSTSTPGDESTTTTDAPATTTTTTTEATTSTTEGPDIPTTPGGDGVGTFSVAFGSGEAYRHTITLDTDEAVRVRAVDDRGADLVLSFTAPEAQAIAWYRAAAAAAPDFFYLEDDATDDDVLLNFYLSSPGLELLDDEIVIDYKDSEFEAPEANWMVASTPGTYTIVLNEWSGGAAGGVTLVIETQTGVDFARAVLEGDDPFLNGPFFDPSATPSSLPTGPTAPSGPPGG